jgi:hypothetical protein
VRSGKEAGESVLRTVWGWRESSLQTAVTEMRQRDSGHRVTLVSVVHVGLPDYYAAIQRLIDQHVAAGGVVLYEGLGSLSEAEIDALAPRERAIYRTLAPLHELYGAFARSLHLVFQGDAIRYDRVNWVNADLPLRELLRRWAESGAPLLPLDAPVGGFNVPDSAIGRTLSALTLLQTPLMLTVLNRLHGRVPTLSKLRELLISDRNRAALDALEQTQSRGDALILYGAGHMQGLREGLERRGYIGVRQSWLTAFTFHVPGSEQIAAFERQAKTLQALWRAARGN